MWIGLHPSFQCVTMDGHMQPISGGPYVTSGVAHDGCGKGKGASGVCSGKGEVGHGETGRDGCKGTMAVGGGKGGVDNKGGKGKSGEGDGDDSSSDDSWREHGFIGQSVRQMRALQMELMIETEFRRLHFPHMEQLFQTFRSGVLQPMMPQPKAMPRGEGGKGGKHNFGGVMACS